LSLILSERRPSYYLLQNREALAVLTDKHLRVLCERRHHRSALATRRSTPS
jgi:hypothetical protein